METVEERSLLLCQLIKDRRTDKEVGAEIRKLLIEGVDINTQDLSYNKNTPLHLAARKSDKIGVRLLLKYKPDLQIRNGSGETPFDIAQSIEVKELLSSASFDVVKRNFVREIEFQDLSLGRLKCLESDPAFKVLKITFCPNAQVVWEKLNQDDYTSAINKSSHLFVIAIELQKDENENFFPPPVDIKRPIIMLITSNVSPISLINFEEQSSKRLVNFSLLLQALNSSILGTFSENLLDVKLNNDKDRTEIVSYFASTNALCHRFFKLFDERLTEAELDARVKLTLKFPGDQSLLALLDLPFEFKDEVELTEDQKRILNFVDSRYYNLMMIAIECNNRDAVKTLLRFSIDLNHIGDDNYSASDLCWEKQNWECLAELIGAGSPYPDNFNASLPSLTTSAAFGEIKSTIEAATAFHKTIQRGDIEAVKLFIESNPKLKQVYDSTNKSALTVSLESDKAEIYSLLLSEGFTHGLDDEYDEALNNCNVKCDIRNKNREYFKNAFDEPHLKRLLGKYKLSFSSTNREACSQVIQKMFLKLNEIPEMVPILQIVSCSERLNIIFDFDCRSVREMDPTVGPSSTGLTYRLGGFIYIRAKNHHEDFFKVVGTLAHELTHYAIELTYENNCKPYDCDDEVNQDIFKSIVDETRNLVQADTSTDSIISSVFRYEQKVWHQELIVRVPHLLASYKNAVETLTEIINKNYRLFHFFRSTVLPDIKSQTKVLMHKLEVSKINSRTGAIEKIEEHEVQLKECEISLKDQIFGSNAPQLTLGMLRQSLDESFHVFISIEQIAYGNISERICKLEEKEFAIVVDCTGMVRKHEATICDIKNIFENSGKIFLVMTSEEASIMTSKLTNFGMNPINHVWGDLTDDSQEALMQKNVNFQGALLSFNEMTNKYSKALKELPLNDFCNSENFKIGDPIVDLFNKFYLARSFLTRIPKQVNKDDQIQIEKRMFMSGLKHIEGIDLEKFETIERSFDEILVECESTKVAIISDSAGTGKTSTLHEIARTLRENDPTRWTILTDLNKHIEKLMQFQEDFETFQDFVIQIILAEKPSFEKVFFAQFHQEGRTNILLDGFDEISPHYKYDFLQALELFTAKSGNQLWITTRSHLELELENSLDRLSCSLQPLTREAQIEFLEIVWTSGVSSSALNSQKNFSIAEGLINKLSSICDSRSSFIGLPILISMVAEIYDDPEKRNSIQSEKLSFYSIFKQFFEKNIDMSSERGEIAEAERKEILKQSEGIVEVHRKIAIALFFGDEIADVDVEYDDEQWTVEKLTRLGLIRYDEAKRSLSFIHETFAEYFLADFIVGSLRTKSRACGAVKILIKVLNGKDFQVVRLFLDQAIKKLNFHGDKKLCDNVGKQLNIMSEEALAVLLNISKESCEEIFKIVLNAIEHVEEPFLLINKRSEEGNNTLHINIGINSQITIKTLFGFIQQKRNSENAKKTILALNVNKQNIFHYACYNKNDEIFSTLHECTVKFLKEHEIKQMLREKDIKGCSVLILAAANCNENAFDDLMKVLKKVLSNKEMKEMFFEVNSDGLNSLDVAVYASNSISIAIKSFFKHLNGILNSGEMKTLIQRRVFRPSNIFHFACANKNDEFFPTLHECLTKYLERHEIKKMLREKGMSFLQSALVICNENSMNGLMKVLKKVFSNKELKEILFKVDIQEVNCMDFGFFTNNKIAIKSFFQHLNEILNSEEIKILLQQKGLRQRNIFHSSCVSENDEIFPTMHECMFGYPARHKTKKMLREKDNEGWSVLQRILASGNEIAINGLLEMLKKVFSMEEVKVMMFEVNHEDDNSLHVALRRNNKIAIKSFFQHLKEILDSEEIKKLLQQKGFRQRNIFHSACVNGNDEILQTLHECTVKLLEKHELTKMLMEKDNEGWSVLLYAVLKCNENALHGLLEVLKKVFSNKEMSVMLFEVCRNGLNCLHAATFWNNKIVLKSFFIHLNHLSHQDLISTNNFSICLCQQK